MACSGVESWIMMIGDVIGATIGPATAPDVADPDLDPAALGMAS